MPESAWSKLLTDVGVPIGLLAVVLRYVAQTLMPKILEQHARMYEQLLEHHKGFVSQLQGEHQRDRETFEKTMDMVTTRIDARVGQMEQRVQDCGRLSGHAE